MIPRGPRFLKQRGDEKDEETGEIGEVSAISDRIEIPLESISIGKRSEVFRYIPAERRTLLNETVLPRPGAILRAFQIGGGVETTVPGTEGGPQETSRIREPAVDINAPLPPGEEEVEFYPVNEPYAYIRITYRPATHEYIYNVCEPVLPAAEEALLSEISQRLFDVLDIDAGTLDSGEVHRVLRDSVDEIMREFDIRIPGASRERIMYRLERDWLGHGLIDAIMHDPYIEDISCDGLNTDIFVYHIKYESIRTNLRYTDPNDLDSFVTRLAQRAGKYISIAEPMLDATLQDGSRIQMTLGREVTANGSTFTIRKFREEPITPIDLIEWKTFSPLAMAYLWLVVETGKSAIFAGGTASGKTTTLNALALFIPPLAKIVSLEDTRELKLPHPNWIPSITRDSFDPDGKGAIEMYELLRAALRQRPEYLLVGEVRGEEAGTLFQAMSTGHVTYATMHADSVASAVHRLENPPINVPRTMLSALDLICIQVQVRSGGQRIRRNKQIIELVDIDPRTNELITNEVFRWHQPTDEIRYTGKSYILEEIMEERGWSEDQVREEMRRRQEVLEWMRINHIRQYQDVSRVLVSYYRDPEGTIARIRENMYEQV
ncbi:MAG: type II/IV secretion system ATPase subunit [Methanoculleaceae archaeon]